MRTKLKLLLTVSAAILAVGTGSTVAYLSQHHEMRVVAATSADEQGDQPALAAQAKVTADQAKAAALAGYPAGATATTPNLEEEDGNVVYSVEVTSGGKTYDVKVDAKSAKVVKTDSGDNDNSDSNTESGDQSGASD